MPFIMVDIESDGPIPGDFSIISFGAVLVDHPLNKTFYGKLKPVSENFIPEALAVSGHTREETLMFDEPAAVMQQFAQWIKEVSPAKPTFISDNNGFDWMFICWYFHHFTGSNPFGFSSQNLGSLFKGIVRDYSKSFKYLRKTSHTHHPVDDAIGNAEAMLSIIREFDMKMKL